MRAWFGVWKLVAIGAATAVAIAGCASSEGADNGGGTGGKSDAGKLDGSAASAGKDGSSDGSGAKDAGKDASSSDAGDGGNCLDEELCDGKDNNCDGTVDEGCECIEGETQVCFTGNQNLVGIGECKQGKETCDINGEWSTCEDEVLPSSEVCDGKDNDCNGLNDDGLGSETCGKGTCTVTTETCIGGQPQVCTPKPPATSESCDGLDNTCDGTIDEGCSCLDGQQQDCYTGDPATKNVGLCKPGKQTCAGGKWGTCQGEVVPAAEVCDGKDDDCDGTTDEGNPGGGAACTTGLSGVCSVGVETCKDGGIKCVQVTASSAETCDNKDNDCNGKVDDGSNGCGGVCTLANAPNSPCDGADLDLCNEGTWTCNGTNAVTCSDSSGNNVETCNNIDDDCDGTTDEGTNACGGACTLAHAPGTSCDGPDTDLCTEGTWQCNGLNTVSCTDATGNNVETCNNIDDDCDGTVDEGTNACGGVCALSNTPGVSCDGADTDSCKEGTFVCNGLNAVTCNDTTSNNVETCNGTDDDCDGTIDEGTNACGGACVLPNTPGSGCDGPDTDDCNEGTWTCSGLNSVTCTDNTGNNVETCNNADDDCDGTIDEGSNACGGVCSLTYAPGTACDGPDTDVCNEGTWTCTGLNSEVCSDNTGNNVEICDAIDQDCDGNISEGPCSLPNASSTCTSGACAITGCNSGYLDCDNTASNGCELTNNAYSNSPPGQSIGNVASDSYGGSGCGTFLGCVLHSTYTGTQSKYFTVVADDQNAACGDYDAIKFVLSVPSGVNYDVSVSSPNQVPGTGGCYCEINGQTPIIGNTCTASNGQGVNDQIVLYCEPPLSGTPDFTVNVEVKYVSGASCSPWSMQVYSHGC